MSDGPQTLDGLLAIVPGMRKMRHLNAEMLRVLLDRPRQHCTWCGQRVPKGKIKWCSERCVADFKLRCDSGFQYSFVCERDKGMCCICGRNIKECHAAAEAEWKPMQHAGQRPWSMSHKSIMAKHGWARGSWQEVDHVIPVCEGGGLLGPDNLRLLCGACHLSETAKLRKRLKAATGGGEE